MKLAGLVLASTGIIFGQSASVIIPSLAAARWTHDPKDGSDSVFLFQDSRTGAMDLLVRYPTGHRIAPHWHSVNERLVLLEGRLAVRAGDGPETTVSAGGVVVSPAREPHGINCISETPCTFYISWDGKLDTQKLQK
jgi:quercetin dioxygenase-like cupin family protein